MISSLRARICNYHKSKLFRYFRMYLFIGVWRLTTRSCQKSVIGWCNFLPSCPVSRMNIHEAIQWLLENSMETEVVDSAPQPGTSEESGAEASPANAANTSVPACSRNPNSDKTATDKVIKSALAASQNFFEKLCVHCSLIPLYGMCCILGVL